MSLCLHRIRGQFWLMRQLITKVMVIFEPGNRLFDFGFLIYHFQIKISLGKQNVAAPDRFFFSCINLAGEDICNFTAVSSIFLLGFSLFIALGSGLRLIFMCPPLFILLPQHCLFIHWLNILLMCEGLWPIGCCRQETFYCITLKKQNEGCWLNLLLLVYYTDLFRKTIFIYL